MAVSSSAVRVAVTAVVVVAAGLVGWRLWDYYTLSPWTQDARVRAIVVNLAPDVSGLVSSINVVDNQAVKKGDLLFVIDRQRFEVAAQQAQAVVELRRQALKLATDTARRDTSLVNESGGVISVEAAETATVAAAEATAQLQEAEAALATANINLTRTEVRSPVNGYVTNLVASVGDYASTGEGVLAVVDSDSFYVDAYFMETKLPRIREGDAAEIRLMAGGAVIPGTVEGVSRAIADPVAAGGDLLANVNPEFDWIRLAQRIPVRIRLGAVPPAVRLVAGLSATVVVAEQP